MRTFTALFGKHFRESRWALGLMAAGLVLFGILWTLGLSWAERRMADNEMTPGKARSLGMFRAFGGEAMDGSMAAMAACVWNHPVVLLIVMGWAISRASAAVAAEVERGTLDLTLSRPVPRSLFLASQVAFGLFGLAVLAVAVVVGELAGWQIFHVRASPTAIGFVRPALMYVALGVAIYGYTLPFSAMDSVRWRATAIGAAITLGGLITMTLARLLGDGYETLEKWLERVSVFRAYAPVTVTVRGDPLAYNGAVLACVFAIGVVVSLVMFGRRDLPANA